MSTIRFVLAAACILGLAVPACAAPRPRPSVPRTQNIDVQRRLDANQLDLFLSNFGNIGYDLMTANSGLYFPRFSGKSLLFASGLWVGGKVLGVPRVTVAEYSSEWGPGAASGGVPESGSDPDHIVYKTHAWEGAPADTGFLAGTGLGSPPADAVAHHGWWQYIVGAVPHGAPMRLHRLPEENTPDPADSVDVPGPDLPGDLATWAVYNDFDPSRHDNNAGSSAPLGLEVKQTVFAFSPHPGDPDGTLDQAAIVRFEIRNAGTNTIDSTYVGYWADPDLGGSIDDLTGFDGHYGFAYAYNATNNDLQYGSTPPALAIALLNGPLPFTFERPFGISAFGRYFGGTDPNSALESFRTLSGFQTNGDPWIDPLTLSPTPFPFDGDPVENTGWLDTNPSDRRMLIGHGPFTLSPGEEVTLTFALVVGQGTNRLDSIRRLRCTVEAVRGAFIGGFQRPFAPLSLQCHAIEALECPWIPQNWADECGQTIHMTPQQLEAIANELAVSARSFGPGLESPLEKFCAGVAASGTARERAVREFYALQANRGAHDRTILLSNGSALGLPLSASVSCPGLTATTVQELLTRCPDGELSGTYVRVDTDQPRDLQPVDFGLEAYDGALGFGTTFFGSSLDHATQPDSFRTVEIHLGPGETQKAYRYLRLELQGGSIPPGGREYRFGGYRDVRFRAVDAASGQILEAAFVERAAVDASGTLLDPGMQPATFDSTWSPDESANGAREYLFVTNLPAQGAPRSEFEQDGYIVALLPSPPPVTYALTLRKFGAGDTPEAGELLRIDPGPPASPGVDRALVVLARAPQDDPATVQAYEELASCLRAINQGSLSSSKCQGLVPALATLVESSATASAVSLAWFIADRSGSFNLERRDTGGGDWRALATLAPDGAGYVRYEDRAVTPGAHLSYRLRGGDVAQGEVSVVVPGTDAVRALAVAARFTPGHDLALDLALPGDAEVTYDLISMAGRRLASGSLGKLAAGHRSVRIAPATRLAPGVYLVRVRQGLGEARAKTVYVR